MNGTEEDMIAFDNYREMELSKIPLDERIRIEELADRIYDAIILQKYQAIDEI